MTGEISNFLGFGKSVSNKEYQNMLNEKFNSTFGDKEKISLSELLRKDKSVFEAYKKLDEQGQSNFEKIISLDGDASTVNEKEYKTLLSVLDAEDVDKTNPNAPMLMNGDFTVQDKNNGIYVLNKDNGINYVYNNVRTKEDIRIANLSEEEVKKELSDAIYDAMYGKSNTVEGDYYTGALPLTTPEMLANAIKTINTYSASPYVSLWEALDEHFGEDFTLRGQGKPYGSFAEYEQIPNSGYKIVIKEEYINGLPNLVISDCNEKIQVSVKNFY